MDAFVGPGIKIGSFGIALARSVVLENIPSYAVYLGNPAKFIKMRKEIKRQYKWILILILSLLVKTVIL